MPDSSAFWGPFFGSFSAFIFGIITFFVTFYFTKRREGFIQHKNALVKLERILNEHADDLIIAKLNADTTKGILEKKGLTDYRFKDFEVDKELNMQLRSLAIINKHFGYLTAIKRLNQDFKAKNHAMDKFEEAMLAGKQIADESWAYMAQSMGEISLGLDRLDENLLLLLVTVRIYLRKIKEQNPIMYGIFNTDFEFSISEAEMATERAKLDSEITHIREEAETHKTPEGIVV